jgi:hypothetical protein
VNDSVVDLVAGEMEKTMFKRFCMGQNLRRLFSQQQVPDQLHPIIGEYEKAFTADIRGTFINDNLAFDEHFVQQEERVLWDTSKLPVLPKATRKLLHEWITVHDPQCITEGLVPSTGYIRTKIGRLGQTFQVHSASVGDSNILFDYSTDGHSWSAGSINSMFSHTRYGPGGLCKTQTFIVVHPYAPLSDDHALVDPFRQPEVCKAGGRLFYNRFGQSPSLIAVDDIHCHFAFTPIDLPTIDEEVINVLPLDR